MDTPPNPDPSGGDERSETRDDEPGVRRREEDAVDAATAERLSDGVRRDVHGEYSPDPYPDERDPGDSTDEVIEHHRRHAERIEHQPDVPRSDD